jgi:c-type cytochrome biogenesis protein CcmF
MLGNLSLAVTLVASIASIVLYILVARGDRRWLQAARFSTGSAIVGMLSACGNLLYYIFTYRFDVSYVYEHVSRKLSTLLLFSTFYASQEGSFMLWGLWTALIAIFLTEYARRQRYEQYVMPIFMSVLAFIALMLVARSPFQTIYSAHPGEVAAGFVPLDGKGLNPSLENLWIVIHPPMLFLGFALLAVPFAFALAGLIRRDYQGWVVTSMPWTLTAGMVLGFGIMLGGFWAYETLGWGGYWGWDPVENASLLPWLVTVAGAHTMLTQKRTGGLVRTNIAMTLLAFGLVLYGSFLTRSGALADFSVHSFASPGNLAYTMLLGALILFVTVPFGLLIKRFNDMRVYAQDYKILSRETSLSIASAVIGASTLVVFIGTSLPLINHKVETDFYNNLHIPIAIVLLLVNGLSLLLKWKQTKGVDVWKKSIPALIFACTGTAVAVLFGVHELPFLLMILSALFSLAINIEVGYKILKGHWDVTFDRSAPSRQDYWRRIGTALGLSIGLGLIAMIVYTAGDYNLYPPIIASSWQFGALTFALLAAVFVVIGYPRITVDTKFLGAYIAHAGVAIFILGVIASARYSEKEIIRLPINQATSAFEGKYTLTFRGTTEEANEHTHWLIDIDNKNGHLGQARPLTFWTDFNEHQEPIRNPGIVKFATRDLYFTLNSADYEGGTPRDTLGKGETRQIFPSTQLTFEDFNFPATEKAKMFAQQSFHVEATVHVKTAKDSSHTLVLGVTRNLATSEAKEEDVVIPGTTYHLQLSELRPDMQNPAKSKVVIRYFDDKNPPPAPTAIITVEAFLKPYINLVWFGILTLVAGFGFSVLRRRREALVAIERAERAYERLTGSLHGHPAGDAAPRSGSRKRLLKTKIFTK